jgi:hypothetical protein
MRTETARLYKDLLSLQGHPIDSGIGDELTGATPASERRRESGRLDRSTTWFESFLLLGGHDPIDPHQANDAIVSPERIGVGHC